MMLPAIGNLSVAETLAGLGRRPLFPADYIENILEPAALANGVPV